MKKKSIFYLLIAMLAIGFIGLTVTMIMALILGESQTSIIDFSNMNFVNVGIVMVIGLIFLCFIFTVLLLIIVKIGFDNIADFIKNKKWEDKK